MDVQQLIRDEIEKGWLALDQEIETHQYDDDDIIHYHVADGFYHSRSFLLPDINPSQSQIDRSWQKLQIKLAVRDALILEESERKAGRDHIPFRPVLWGDPYFQEGEPRDYLELLWDGIFGMFSSEKQYERTRRDEKSEIRQAVLAALRNYRNERGYEDEDEDEARERARRERDRAREDRARGDRPPEMGRGWRERDRDREQREHRDREQRDREWREQSQREWRNRWRSPGNGSSQTSTLPRSSIISSRYPSDL